MDKLKNILLLIFSVYLPLLFFEYYFLINKKALYPNYDAMRIEKSQERTSRVNNLIKEARSNNFQRNIYIDEIKLFSYRYNIFPIGTVPNKDIYYCDEGYGLVTFKSDRFGLRNNDSVWSSNSLKNKNQTFFIGDSYIQGACVENNQTISELFRKFRHKDNIVNLGSSGIGPNDYRAILKLIVEPTLKYSQQKTDVILTFYANDRTRIKKFDKNQEDLLYKSVAIVETSQKNKGIFPTNFYVESLNEIVRENINLKPSLSKGDISNRLFLPDFKLSNLQYFLKNRVKATPFFSSYLNQSFNKTYTYKAINALRTTCKKKCNPYIIYIPNSEFWRPDSTANTYKNNISETASKFGIPFLDTTEIINPRNNKNYALEGPHLSPLGYEKVAKGIYQFVLDNQ